ncbi:cyclin-like protein [Naematelia encephala]|uniref:Cyclin-like protein n=1 Tax=Naematelia encephala TaxID=71784 RepID=A0A1Y2B4W2_9TREE|nr:cyclin-like protein [Naematelia encephala]
MTSDPSSSQASPSHIKVFRPYLSPSEVERLSAKQRGKLSVSREEKARQQACGFIDAVGVRCGFPRRTIATAQTLYMRFHLFFPYKDFSYIEVSLSTLYVSSKLHDTLKKPREIILASLPLRFPHLVKKGALDMNSLDPAMLEGERRRVLSIERLVLESLCFKFGVAVGFGDIISCGKRLNLPKEVVEVVWRVSVDCYRTPAPLSFPPHIIALGSMYTAALLSLESTSPSLLDSSSASISNPSAAAAVEYRRLVDLLGNSGDWETEYSATAASIDHIAHSLLDLYMTVLSLPSDTSISAPSPISPRETSSPAQNSTTSSTSGELGTAYHLPPYWTAQTLTELKIWLRIRRPSTTTAWVEGVVPGTQVTDVDSEIQGLGNNDGTIRFLWEPEQVEV